MLSRLLTLRVIRITRGLITNSKYSIHDGWQGIKPAGHAKTAALQLSPPSPSNKANSNVLTSMMILPTGAPSAVMSKKTLVVAIVGCWRKFFLKMTESLTEV